MLNNENFFSVIKTLLMALGNQDPCQDLYKFANGLKNGNMVSGEIQEQTLVVQSATEVLNNDWPKFDSEVHLKQIPEVEKKESGSGKVTCKILVLFAEDGVVAAETAIQISRTLTHPVSLPLNFDIKIDFSFLCKRRCRNVIWSYLD